MVASLIVSPLAGLAIGLAVAALLLASRGRMPTMSEGVKMFAALVLIAAFLVVLEGWGEVKEGVAEVFRRVWPR